MILTFIVFVVILGLLVFIHELGHFVTAKKSGVKVEEFGFGLPPRIFGIYKDKKSNTWRKVGIKTHVTAETIYSLNWIPLGGFVKIKGEQGENAEDSDSFVHKSIFKRILIVSAGVIMNILLAIFLFFIGYMIGMPKEIDSTTNSRFAKIKNEEIIISAVFDGLPAKKNGIVTGDAIQSIDNNTFTTIEKIQEYMQGKKDTTINVQIKRMNQTITFTLTPEIIQETKKVGIGVGLTAIGTVSYPWYIAIFESVKITMYFIKEILIAFYNLIKNLIITHRVSVELSGPVGIAVMTGEVTRLGFIYILQFAALLSINLAIINFMPFPALDGGRVLFLIIEKLRGKAVNARIESLIHSIGLYVLLLLVVVVTYKDILKFSDKFKSLWSSLFGLF